MGKASGTLPQTKKKKKNFQIILRTYAALQYSTFRANATLPLPKHVHPLKLTIKTISLRNNLQRTSLGPTPLLTFI